MFARDNMKKVIAMTVAVATLFVMLSSFLYVTGHVDHQCSGNDCPVCAMMNQCTNNLKQLGSGTGVSIILPVIFLAVTGVMRAHDYLYQVSTLISQKVRLNN